MATDDSFHYQIEYTERPPSEVRDSLGSKVTTIRCHGRLVAKHRDQVEEIFKHTAFHGPIYIDLDDVSYVDSAGLGSLVRLKFSAMKQEGVSVKFVNIAPRVMQLLRITNLLDWFSS